MMPNKDSLADASGVGRAPVAPCQGLASWALFRASVHTRLADVSPAEHLGRGAGCRAW